MIAQNRMVFDAVSVTAKTYIPDSFLMQAAFILNFAFGSASSLIFEKFLPDAAANILSAAAMTVAAAAMITVYLWAVLSVKPRRDSQNNNCTPISQ